MNYHMTTEARQTAVRHLRLAHARHMEAFDRFSKVGNMKEAGYWLMRASETHARLLDLGEVAI
jgi:hypothetical protein